MTAVRFDPKRRRALAGASALALLPAVAWPASTALALQSWPLKTARRAGIHDVAPAPDGGVWFTAQRSGHLGWFDPKSGQTELVALGPGSSPHGVIQGPDRAAWITDGGQQAIVRVSWPQRDLRLFRLPEGTAYGICGTPSGDVWWCSLAGSFIARIDRKSGESQIVEPPTAGQGARRVWSDSQGRIWVSEWNSGQLSVHDPRARGAAQWRQWKLPGANPRCYAVWVDERDMVWASDFGANAVLRFDPGRESFDSVVFPREAASVRRILGRPGEVWLPESGHDVISVIRTA